MSFRTPRAVWKQLRVEAVQSGLPVQAIMERIVQEVLLNPPCVCDDNRCGDDPCYGNCGCVACRRLGERE